MQVMRVTPGHDWASCRRSPVVVYHGSIIAVVVVGESFTIIGTETLMMITLTIIHLRSLLRLLHLVFDSRHIESYLSSLD